jgi:hypothetical protein
MKLMLTACIGALMTNASAATITIACPEKFPREQISFTGTPAGWTPYTRSSLEVTTAEMLSGPPSSYTYLVPFKYTEGKRRDVAMWGFAPGAETEKWLQCGYGAASEVSISRPLPAATSECTVTRTKDANSNVTKVVAVCKLEP